MDFSELLLIEEIRSEGVKAFHAARGLTSGALIKMIRKQIGMPQAIVSQKAKVPQSTISRIEKGHTDPSLATLRKILEVLQCDLLILPVLRDSVSSIRRKEARKKAEKKVHYVLGTMHLEDQEPDQKFTDALLQQEEEKFLRGPNAILWKED